MERLLKIGLLCVAAGIGAFAVQLTLLVSEGFWTPFTIGGLWHDIAGKAPPFGGLITSLLGHSIGIQLIVAGLFLLLGAIIAEDIVANRRRNSPPNNWRAANQRRM